jgi:hypothetical protein
MEIRKIATRRQSALEAIFFHASALFVASVSMSGIVLSPVAVLAGALGAWRLGGGPGWTSDFFIADGLLSRYQFWFAVAIGAQMSAFTLNQWVANQNVELSAPTK